MHPTSLVPRSLRRLFLLCTGLLSAGSAPAALTVYAPQEITHEVVIQPIRVHKTNGSTATYLGDASTEAYIKDQIGRAWAQLGVQITWLPLTEYTNNFAYDGSPGNYNSTARPTSHLATIVDDAPAPPKSASAVVVNMFFVEIVPGFPQTSANTANGLAFVDANGITVHVGANLLTWTAGRDVVASVIGHEIGHNLGLSHYGSSNNIMYSGSNSADYLVASQESTIFTNNGGYDGYDLLQTYAPPTNFDVWATSFGLTGGPDGDDDGDQMTNAFEFLYGSLPNTPNTFPAPSSTPNGPVWTLPKQADAVADGFDYNVLCGTTTDEWHPAGSAGCSTVLQDNNNATKVRLNAGQPAAFLKVDVTTPPMGASATVVLPPSEPGERSVSGCSVNGCGLRELHRVR